MIQVLHSYGGLGAKVKTDGAKKAGQEKQDAKAIAGIKKPAETLGAIQAGKYVSRCSAISVKRL